MEDTVLKAALAGLLHDVGKFAQRAGERGSRIWDDQAKKDFGYFHALLTADFIDHYVPDAWKKDIKALASNHHRPAKREEYLLALADHLSAGERSQPTDDDRKAQPRQLLSIFCDIQADEMLAPKDSYWPLAELALKDEIIFPGEALPDQEVWKIYENLWCQFCAEAGKLRDAQSGLGNLAVYVESMLLLFQRYTWCMPSAYYNSRPDISLYDHARMTAALAAILAGSSFSGETLSAVYGSPENSPEELALLVGGDISGVQDFLYTISARGATSALRGRSFYLQLLTDAAARFVLRQLGLPAANLIYSGGGNFYLVARPGDRERLRDIQLQVSQVLFYHHRGDLYLALAGQRLTAQDFYKGRISQAWEGLSQGLQQAKQHRFAELGTGLVALFEPQGHGGNLEQQCQVCGAEHPQTHVDPKAPAQEGEEAVRKCPACFSYEDLGESLRQAEYLVLEQPDIPKPPSLSEEPVPGDWADVLSSLGMKVKLLGKGETIPADNGHSRLILALSDEGLARLGTAQDYMTAVGRRLLVNVTPAMTGQDLHDLREKNITDLPGIGSTKPFHALEAQSCGIPRLGVLRMDMDNLGGMFAEGLGQQATLSRVASLSFAVSLYFEGWVEVLAARKNESDASEGLGARLYSIYSGGDDLFFVGAWDAIVEFARQVRIDLAKFAAGHLGVHASAGIVLVGGKYPLARAAQDAGQAEQQAKSLRWQAEDKTFHTKDAVAFLGQALPWRKLGLEGCDQPGIQTAHALMHMLVDLDQYEHSISTPLIRRLIGLHERHQEVLKQRREAGADRNRSGDEQVLWGPWMWLGYYSLNRLFKQSQVKSIKELNEQLKQDNFRSIEWIGLAARWAELLLR